MSSPIPIPARNSDGASPSRSPALYVPVHRRTPGSYTSSSSSGTPSPSHSPLSSPALSPSSTHLTLAPTPTPASASTRGIYTPAELLLLSTSPLAKLSAGHVDALRALAPEVVQTRKQRKALAWHTRPRHPSPTDAPQQSHQRSTSSNSRGSHAHGSESEEDRATTWRRI